MLGLRVHAGLPGVLGHPRQGEEQQGQAAQEEEHEGRAGAGKGPGVIVLDPDRVLAVDHALHRLPQHLHRDEDAETWGQSGDAQGPTRPGSPVPRASRRDKEETWPWGRLLRGWRCTWDPAKATRLPVYRTVRPTSG